MKLNRILRILAKISIVMAVLVTIVKFMAQPEYQNWMQGGEVEGLYIIVMIFNVLFNIFLFVGASAAFSALATLLERSEKN